MSDLVGNPEDRFSHNEAHLRCVYSSLQILLPLEVSNTTIAKFVNTEYPDDIIQTGQCNIQLYFMAVKMLIFR